MYEKIALIRALREREYHGEQVIHLYKVVDYMITLSERIEQLVGKIVREFEAESEWPLTSLEELAIKRGAAQGLEQGLEQGLQQALQQGLQQGTVEMIMRILQRRYGEVALSLKPKLQAIQSVERLQELGVAAAESTSLEGFERLLGDSSSAERLSS